jgi:putative chitinase
MRVDRNLILAVAPNNGAPQHVADVLTMNLERFHVDSPERLAAFVAQIAHESEFAPVRENTNYSNPFRLAKVFPSSFTPLIAMRYIGKPQAIANRAYANRLGNGSEASGDGWKYRGGGLIQITGKGNYQALSAATGIDYLKNPDLITQLEGSVVSALWWWNSHGLNTLADFRAFSRITRVINGPAMLGEADRERRWGIARAALGLKKL